MVPHRMVAWNAYNTGAGWQLREDDVSPIFTPLYHAGGLGAFLVPIFAIGGTIVLHRGFDAGRDLAHDRARSAARWCSACRRSGSCSSRRPSSPTADLSHVRWLISGGAPLPLYIIEAYQRARRGLQAGLRPDRGGRQLLRHDGRGLGPQEGLDRQAADVHRGAARRTRTGARCRPARWASCGCAARTSARATGTTPRRPPRRSTPTAGSTPATSRAATRRASSTSPAARRTCSSPAASTSTRPRSRPSCCCTPACATPRWSACPTTPGARSASPSSCRRAAPASRRRPSLAASSSPSGSRSYKLPEEFVFVDELPRTPYGKVVKGELRRSARCRASDGSRLATWFGTAPARAEPLLRARARATTASRGDGTRMLAHRVDGAGPPLLLNGGMMSIRPGSAVAAPLARAVSRVRCDFRGQLLAPPSCRRPTSPAHAADVVALLDHLGLESGPPRRHLVRRRGRPAARRPATASGCARWSP